MQILHRAAALIRERADPIARTMTLEQGKPFAAARGELMGSTKLLDIYAEEAKRQLRADHPVRPRHRADGDPPAGRSGGGVRALELPGRLADAQDLRFAGGRLLDHHQALRGDARHDQRDRPLLRRGGCARRRAEPRVRRPG